MALAAANERVGHLAAALGTKGFHLYVPPQPKQAALDGRLKSLVLAGIGARDFGDRAAGAQIPAPGLFPAGAWQQAALLVVPAAIIVTVKIRAFRSCRGSHEFQTRVT